MSTGASIAGGRPDHARRRAHVVAALIGIPSLAGVVAAEGTATDALASVGGLAAASGVLAAVLLWRQAPAARWVYGVWAVLVLIASFYPVPQLPGEPLWSAVISALFAVVLVILGREIWRVTPGPAV